MIDFENNDYDYDEDDFDEWHQTNSQVVLESRRNHVCAVCNCPIEKGDSYVRVTKTDGRKKKQECQCFACAEE